LITAVFTDLLTDTMYVVHGTDVLPMLRGEPLTGTWRSKVIVRDDHPGFGWLRINGELSAPATIRLYADDVLFYSVEVPDREPVRIPAGRYREWEIEVVGVGRMTTLTLATSAKELQAT
jgi:hypothetical protein